MTLSAPAWAEQAATADEKNKAESLEEVVITGTLIRGIAPAASNVISTTRQDIESSGATDANQLLGTLPQSNFFMTLPQPGGGVQQGVGRVPINLPNLRNLPGGATGNPVTLVMIDGHRVVPAGIEQSAVDVGIVPPGVLESVETMLDGASAVYGSDAVGGVINYITRKPFNETKVDGQYGYADNYYAVDGNATSGKTWDGGGVDFTFSYGKSSDLLNKDRSYALAHNYLLPGAPLTGTACEDHSTVTAAGQTFTATPAAGVLVPTLTAGTVNCAVNAYSSFVAAQERYAGFMVFSQDITDSIKFDMTAFYSTRKAAQNFGPFLANPTVRNTNPYFLPMPGIPAASQTTQTVSFSYGPVLGTDAQRVLTGTSLWQVAPGISINVGKWQIRTLFSYGRSRVTYDSPVLDTTGQNNAFAATSTTTATAIDPYNVAATTALTNITSLVYKTHRHGDHKFTNARVIADGPLFAMPGGDMKAAVGAEWSKTQFSRVDTNAARLLAAPITASTSPKSLFGELNVPLIGEPNKRAGIQELTLSASLRWDDYQDFGKTTNPKIAISYKPVDWLGLRASWGKSFRAPTVVDKVSSQANSLLCLGNVAGQGCIGGVFFYVPPIFTTLPPNAVAIYLTGAKPDLQPETSKNWSFGFDLRPIEGLTISPTYFHIDYANTISLPTQGPTGGLDLIYAGAPQLYTFNPTPAQLDAVAAAAPTNGALVVNTIRSNNDNVLYIIDGRTTNLGAAKVSGLDLMITYRRQTGFGSIDAMLNASRQLENKVAFFAGATAVDTLAANTSLLRFTAQVGANIGNFRAQGTLQHQQGYDVTASATRLASQTHISSFDLVNMSFRYNVNGHSPLSQDIVLTLTVNNVLNKDPPLSLTTSSGSANGQTLGRFAQFGIAKKF